MRCLKQQRSNGQGKGSKKQGSGAQGGKQQNRSSKQKQEKKVAESQDTAASAGDDRPEQAPIEEQAKVAADFVSGLLGRRRLIQVLIRLASRHSSAGGPHDQPGTQ